MKKIFKALLLWVITPSLFAQQSILSMSDDFKVKDKGLKDQSISNMVHVDDFFYSVSNSAVSGSAKMKYVFAKLYDVEYGITIAKFDKNMNVVKQLELEDGKKEFGPVNPDIFLFNHTPYIAYFKSEDKSAFSFYIAPINKETLELGKSIEVYTKQQENVSIFKIQRVLEGTNIHITQSPNQEKLWILFREEGGTLASFVFDKNLAMIKQAEFKLTKVDAVLGNLLLSNNLDQFFLESHTAKPTIRFQSAKGASFNELLYGTGDMNPYHTSAKIAEDGNRILIAASSSSANTNAGCNGFLLYSLDMETANLSEPKPYPYDTPFYETLFEMGTTNRERKKEIFYHHFFPKILELENGKIALTGSPERTIIIKSASTSTSASGAVRTSTNTSVTTYVGPILVFFPNEKGETFAYSVIPRSFTLSEGEGLDMHYISYVPNHNLAPISTINYIALKKGNEILIMYNTLPANLNLTDMSKLKNAKSPNDVILAETQVNPANFSVQSRQLGEKSGKYTYLLENLIPTNSNQIIFPIGRERLRWTVYGKRDVYTNWCFILPKFR